MRRARYYLPGLTVLLFTVTVVAAQRGADTIPAALARLVDTERAFAKQAADTTLHAAFVTFFADESVSFAPDAGPARERLRQQPHAFPPALRMMWEPRVGDIAASGDLGYLTGPVESTMPGRPLRYGNYFSVWKKQVDGEYRVILDVGSGQPDKPSFADGFVRAPSASTYTGTDTKAAAEASLIAADRTFAAAMATNASDAYAAVMHPAGRLHRDGYLSMRTREAAAGWMRDHVKSMASEPLKSETAASRDLGYTWGRFTMTSSTSDESKGYYVRVWTRKSDGVWQLVADIA